MAFPRLLFGIPFVLAGLLVPAVAGAPGDPAPGILGMTHEGFTAKEVRVPCGQRLTMKNTSRFVHIIGPGQSGLLADDTGGPEHRRVLIETGDEYTTGVWRHPGVHQLTCSVHPEMTVKVVVDGSCCCGSGAA